MGFIERGNAVVAVAAVAGATLLVNPAPPVGSRPNETTAEVGLTSASIDWQPRLDSKKNMSVSPRDVASLPDQIDDDFIDFRYAARTDFTEFANQLGYFGKQLYIGYNLIESIVASAVFNGTDVARGEGVLRNIGQFANDVLLSTLFVAIDEISLAAPGTYPIAIGRPPLDHPGEWGDALAPNRYDPLFVPPRYDAARHTDTAGRAASPFLDGIDNAFIDGTVAFRSGVTPALNLLGPVGRQLYIGVNFVESVAASLVFNGTDILRGEGLIKNLGEIAADVGRSAVFVAIDEVATVSDATAIAIDRAPLDRPARWSDADPPFADRPLTVPDRSDDLTVDTTEKKDNTDTTEKDTTDTKETPTSKRGLFPKWKAAREEKAAQREAREAEKTDKSDKSDKTDKSDRADTSDTGSSAGD
jgi:hypothetical protein